MSGGGVWLIEMLAIENDDSSNDCSGCGEFLYLCYSMQFDAPFLCRWNALIDI